MRQLVLWQMAAALCGLATWFLVPIALASTWLAKKARAGEHRADMEVLCALAHQRIRQQRLNGTQK